MKVLSSSRQIRSELRRLLNSYPEYSWAIAWATDNDLVDLLHRHSSRIRQLAIGTDRFITAPSVLEQLVDVSGVNLVPSDPSRTFHPKVYLFENCKLGTWECITGSSNFTNRGLTVNHEMGVSFGNDDFADRTITGLRAAINGFWKLGDPLTKAIYLDYYYQWASNRPPLDSMPGYRPRRRARRTDVSELQNKTWAEFSSAIFRNRRFPFPERAEIIREAKRMFSSVDSFSDLLDKHRKMLVGMYKTPKAVGKGRPLDWGAFGSTVSARHFKNKISRNNRHISAALDFIPSSGVVSKSDYESYRKEFLKAFPNGGAGIGTVTRLLAMKRPDYFVCVNNANKAGLAKALGISVGSLRDEDYWDDVVGPVVSSVWWRSRRPSAPRERALWDARAAFVDTLYYQPLR